MAVRPYAGTERPQSTIYDNDPNLRTVEVDAADGSLDRGWQHIDSGALVGLCTMVVSPARQAALDAANAARAVTDAQIATFRQSIRDLAQKVRDNTATPAEQRQLLVKLARVADGVLADL